MNLETDRSGSLAPGMSCFKNNGMVSWDLSRFGKVDVTDDNKHTINIDETSGFLLLSYSLQMPFAQRLARCGPSGP